MRLISSFADKGELSDLPPWAPARVGADFSADDKTNVVPEDDGAEFASKVHEAVDRAKAMLRALGPVTAESAASRSLLADVGAQVHLAATRRSLSPLGRLAPAPATHAAPLGEELRRLDAARLALSDDHRFGPPVAQPFAERSTLGRLSASSARATTELSRLAEPARAALGIIEDSFGQAQQARQAQLQMLASENGAGGAEETSAGCHCDPSSRCELNGQAFAWCKVQHPGPHGSSCAVSAEVARDPLGTRSHRLGDSDGHWDYCVPRPALAAEAAAHPGASKTAHFNCRCAPREDILQRYADEQGTTIDAVDPKLVPQSDRLAVEAMQFHRGAGGELCSATASSGGFAVCPVASDCSQSGAGSSGSVSGIGGASPNAWFSGSSVRSWDFCVPSPISGKSAGAPVGTHAPVMAQVPLLFSVFPSCGAPKNEAADFFPRVSLDMLQPTDR